MTGAMVRATLEDRKTQTRRIIKPQPTPFCSAASEFYGKPWLPVGGIHKEEWPRMCPYGPVGRRLWARETWAPLVGGPCAPGNPVMYRATEPEADKWTWKPSIFMPRWASRITLEVTGIRVERLQDITPEDCVAEGIPWQMGPDSTKLAFLELWESINGRGSWALNSWVWVIEFRRVKP
jgi:hypothetical protein